MGFRITDLPQVTGVQDSFPLEIVDLNEPNLANQSKRVTVGQLREFMLTGLPPSPGKWVTQPTITVTNNGDGTATVNVTAGQADWDGEIVDYLAASYTKPLPSEGLQRLDAVAAKADGTYEYKDGQVSQNPATPAISTGALLVNYVLFNSSGGDVTQPPQQISVVDLVEQGNLNAVTSNAVAKETLVRELFEAVTVNLNGHGLDFDNGAGTTFAPETGWVEDLANYYAENSPGYFYARSKDSRFPYEQMGKMYLKRLNTLMPDGSTKYEVIPTIEFRDGQDTLTHVWEFREQLYLNDQPYGGGGSGATTLAGLTDTNITSLTDGQVLKYNATSGKWEPATDNTGTGGTADLTDYKKKAVEVTFDALKAFDRDYIMTHTLTADVVLTHPSTGNVPNTYRTLFLTGNDTAGISFGTGWKNGNGGSFNKSSLITNMVTMWYVNEATRIYYITPLTDIV